MQHTLPPLGFAPDALAPFLSAETLAYHHGKHHRGYVDKLNKQVQASDFEGLALTELVQRAKGPVFNNAAQHYNHAFYWRCIAPDAGKKPSADLLQAIVRDFGSLAELKEAFSSAAGAHFGSGWCWLVRDRQDRLQVRTTSNAGCPLAEHDTPLLTCDVWEHAYYIDYRNDRAAYVTAFWNAVDWGFASLAFSSPDQIENVILAR